MPVQYSICLRPAALRSQSGRVTAAHCIQHSSNRRAALTVKSTRGDLAAPSSAAAPNLVVLLSMMASQHVLACKTNGYLDMQPSTFQGLSYCLVIVGVVTKAW